MQSLSGHPQKEIDGLYDFFLDHLDFKLYRCGVSLKDLPYCERWMDYPDVLFSQVLKARNTIRLASAPDMVLQPGEAAILPAKLLATSECLPDGRQTQAIFRWMHFQFFLIHSIDIFDFFQLPCQLSAEQAEILGDIVAQIDQIHHGCDDDPLRRAVWIKRKAFEFLDAVFQWIPLRSGYTSLLLDELKILKPALDFMAENYPHPVTVEMLAHRVNLSPSRFHVIFKSALGKSPIDYLIDMRIKHSQRLLFTSHLSIKEVAAQSGYSDQLTFSKVFKARVGMPPTEYRRRYGPHAGRP